MSVTQEQKAAAIKAYLEVVRAVLDTIRECGEDGTPAGVLYAALMETGMTLERFQQLMGVLVDAGQVTLSGHVYRYTGGKS